MIDLGYQNELLRNIVTERLANGPTPTAQLISDFDGVTIRVSTPERDNPAKLTISLAMACYEQLKRYGADAIMEREYPGMTLPTPEQGYDYSLQIDLSQIPEDAETRETIITKLALIKRNALAAPFERAFDEHEQLAKKESARSSAAAAKSTTTNLATAAAAESAAPSEKGELMIVQYREEEAIFIQASADRVTVIFSTVFREETDRVFAKVFLQEFYDARRRPAVQNAPQVLFTIRDPPLEIRGLPGLRLDDNIGYVTFVLFPRHFATNPEKREHCISHIQMFRNTLHFHIKASKAYMHQRMRARVAEFLKVLNRAKPENQERAAKTATGRAFVRR
ncbi:Arp complex subunit [Savitreella phatthalungensis]